MPSTFIAARDFPRTSPISDKNGGAVMSQEAFSPACALAPANNGGLFSKQALARPGRLARTLAGLLLLGAFFAGALLSPPWATEAWAASGESGATDRDLARRIDPSAWNLSSESELFYYYLLLSDSLMVNDRQAVSLAIEGLIRLDPSLPIFQDSATILLARGEFAKAETTAERGLALFPNDTLLTLLLSSAYSETGHLPKALTLLERQHARNPADQQLKEALVRLYLAAGETDKASAILSTMSKFEDNEESELFRARVLGTVGRYSEARQALLELLEKSPDMVEAWGELGFIYEREKNFPKAIEAYEKATAMQPENQEIWFRICALQIENGLPDEAMQTLEKAAPSVGLYIQASLRFADAGHYDKAMQLLNKAAINGANPDELALFSSLYQQESSKDPLNGLPALEKIAPESPLYPAALQQKTRIYLQAEQYDKAYSTALDGRKAFPERKELWGLEAYALVKLGKNEEAEKLLKDSLERYPDDTELLYSLGGIQDQIGKKDAAMRTMERIIAANPRHYQALNYVGYTLAESNRELPRAYELISIALEEKPDADYIVDSMAWVLYQMGRHEEAWEHMQRCIELGGDDAAIWEHYGDIALKLGKMKEALKGYTEAVIRKPDNIEELRKKLVRLQARQ
ncbi:tetratricopeptide repeat protein [Desulfovibrio sp. OttesenSCG-928-A18]|nr:tetratricopeptide repeat protein [Desulfovibrio sp. OttesenSCG-928-A18]